MATVEERDKLQKSLSRFLKKYPGSRKIICFGNNDVTAETIKYLNGRGVSVDCIFDNKGSGENENKIPVVRPEECEVSKEAFILIGSKYYNEMKQQLLGLGYSKGQIIQTIKYVDMYIPQTDLKVFLSEAYELIKAKAVYKRAVSGMNRDGLLFISPAKSIGDIYLILMYTKAYIRDNNIGSFRYVITGGAAEAVCRACGVTDYIRLTLDEMFMLCKLVRFLDLPDSRALICNEIMAYTNLGKNIIGYGKYNNFSLCYKKSVLAMKKCGKEFESPLLKYEGDIHEIFRKNNLTEGRTVLLAPYTNYLKPLPNDLWTELVMRLKEKGFCVCTNCASDSEKPVRGSIPINLSFREICPFLETAGYFIGARSGLCDVISSSNADIHILYRSHMESRFIEAHDYYSLQRMELTEKTNIREYVWRQDTTVESMAEEIISGMRRTAG